jgi:hypothetical protein
VKVSSAGLLAFVVVAAACDIPRGREERDGGSPVTPPVSDGGPVTTPLCDTNELHCSSDLHAVVDCAGTTVQTCPPDQGCARGACVPACESAVANQSSVGCDYYSYPIDDSRSVGSCFAVFVANTWNVPVSLSVERAHTTLDVSAFARIPSGSGKAIGYTPLPGGKLPPGQVAILFLADLSKGDIGGDPFPTPSRSPCPVTPAITTPAFYARSTDAAGVTHIFGGQGPRGTARANAFHIVSSAPVVAYDIFPYGGGSSAITSSSLLLPTSAWGTNYLAVEPYRSTGESPPETIAVIANEDGTAVTLAPKVAILPESTDHIVTKPVPGAPKGKPVTYTLAAGEVLQLGHGNCLPNCNANGIGFYGLTGSPIQANKPILLVTATPCTTIDSVFNACDSLHQQIPPVSALGHEYVAVKYRNRWDLHDDSPPWHLLGMVDGTQLSYEPAAPPGAPSSLARGELAEFRAPGPFVVRSQDDDHPFYAAGYMSGAGAPNAGGDWGGGNSPYGNPGDPELVNLVSTAQYLSRYVFFTDPTYPETNLVVVRKREAYGFAPVVLDCAGALTGWTRIDTSGQYEYTRIDLVRHDFEPQNGCDNGIHEVHSDAPFTVTVWGWGTSETGGSFDDPSVPGFYSQNVSYGYPAGMGLRTITTVSLPPIP